ncbi:BamA/TamA family outer membrane protein [Bacteroidales bacterium OttesenSCG-928-B11]|nr:BamA/TamA family outer membrane protein [Bacteroidales bacterium OttesenSCG-928-C03]MDL2312881.1 BamA/TamA family outer membrane protein [Bacteroidales bacterium OttesenSCG-928-B11]MDL2326213.1 BamA/TamA family outer membrane protein [Bacteroidales bacterium OttesenSCG-928-A14]
MFPISILYRNILFLSLLLVHLAVFSQENYEIRKIKFKGNKAFDKETLADQLTISSANAYQRIVKKKEASVYNKELIDYELDKLRNFYQIEGFLYAETSIDTLILKERKKKKRVDIQILIEEKSFVKVDSIRFVFLDTLTDDRKNRLKNRLLKNFALQKNKRFNENDLHNDIGLINEMYQNRGFVYVNTTFDLALDEQANTVSITYTVSPNKISQFGDVTILGNGYTKESFIRKQLTFNSGERYSKLALEKTRGQIYDLQNFRIVSISPQTNFKTKANPVPIRITIQEIPRWQSKFAIGYGTEDKFRAYADVTYRGLFGGTSRLNFFVKHSSIYPYHVSFAWTEPRFFVRKLSLSVNPYIEMIDDPAYVIQRFGVNIPVTYSFNRYFSMALTYYFERVKDQTDYSSASSGNSSEVAADFYSKSGLSGSFTFNNANPITSPEKGWTITLGSKLNGYIFGGEHNYFKYWLDVRKYFKVRKFVFAIRGMGGAIFTTDNVPVEDLFYSGGSSSNRGWKRSALGPMDANGRPTGGKSIIEMNFEVRRHLFWRIELAAFTDFGNVWWESTHYELKNLEYTVGGGIRVNTPIGPIRVDIGVPVASKNKTVRFVLSVGQAF